jgi:histidinol-phosphate phosphatase family protein
VFLDRDGTLIVEKGYLRDPDQAFLEDTVVEGLSMLSAHGHPLIVVSNQSGIGRGMLTDNDAQHVNARVDSLLRSHGISILAWYFCPHAPDMACTCRKPLPALAIKAAEDWALTLPGCFVVGDKRSDVEMADAIGGTGILLTTGHGRDHESWAKDNARPVFDHFRDAASFILQQRTSP